ncbi:hypothetical protein ACFWY6_18910 [Streptomyces sp. NPDC059037]|uniref:hypothetical protein n=1 Tax=Streptomyces sp. NPDC059037 TaxID=3346710 RepID=UPI0036CE0576
MRMRTLFASVTLATVTIIGGAGTAGADDGPGPGADATRQQPTSLQKEVLCGLVSVGSAFDNSTTTPRC